MISKRMPRYDPEALRDNIRRVEGSIQSFLNKVSQLQKDKTGLREAIKRTEDNIQSLLDGVQKLQKEKHDLGLLLDKVEGRKL